MGEQRRRREHSRFSDLTQKEQADTIRMGRLWLGGETLGEIAEKFPYRKFKIGFMICLLHGYNSTSGPGFRKLRALHRLAKANREAALPSQSMEDGTIPRVLTPRASRGKSIKAPTPPWEAVA